MQYGLARGVSFHLSLNTMSQLRDTPLFCLRYPQLPVVSLPLHIDLLAGPINLKLKC